ncbi:MAG: hypothetical protein HY895_16335 [Deltaproteobacteria bacterium]|nr:hypothetical protein [Deltaproteobacteria bacterium]
MRNVAAFLLSVLFLTSCAVDTRSISKDHFAVAHVASEYKVVYPVERIVTLPSGDYRSIMENDSGIFFVAPSRLVMDSMGLFDGGVFVPFDKSRPMFWINIPGGGIFVRDILPQDFKLALNQ